ncbi:MAG: hypothetical protein H0V25_08445 [Solirubrobacterales bacterium]|nr:hypothetical protein [Solirubrobacterales bacterium]
MRERVGRLTIVGAALAVAITGCGGDDAPIEPVSASTTSAAATLSQDDFIVSADARCGEANAAIANLTSATSDSSTSDTQELQITQGLIDGLQGIGDAEDPDGSLADFYAALDEEVGILGQQESALADGDTSTSSSLELDLNGVRSDAESAATRYGFEECGRQGSTLPGDATSTGSVPGATTPSAPTPVTPAEPVTPVTPVTPAPVTPAPAPGGTAGGTTPPAPPATGDSGGSSGGISPG